MRGDQVDDSEEKSDSNIRARIIDFVQKREERASPDRRERLIRSLEAIIREASEELAKLARGDY